MDIILFLLICCIALGIISFALIIFLLLSFRKRKRVERRFAPIIDMEREVEKLKAEKQAVEGEINDLRTSYQQEKQIETEKLKAEKQVVEGEISDLRSSYQQKRQIYEELVKLAAIYNEQIELAELGFYEPHFDYDTPEKYKEELQEIRRDQKDMIAGKQAVTCSIQWHVEGSRAKGETMTNRAIRLTARAFNNECDAAIANVRWNNVERMKERIKNAFKEINKLNESNKINISDSYLDLKLKELYLAYEYQEAKQKQKEEQAEIRRQMREEEQLKKEVEKVLKEEADAEKALQRARVEAEQAVGTELEALNAKIEEMTRKLEEAHEKGRRAQSMAEQTRSGHVYVISNIGSFGENVYKIGMTRRLDPLDRVKELGDASVPFNFDVHAMIYSDDAPTLENELHRTFANQRINLINLRREFFRVSLEQIEERTTEIWPDASFTRTAEAREFHETQAIRSKRIQQEQDIQRQEALPMEI